MLNQYGLLADQENMDYGRYRDTLSDYNAELDRLYNMYNTERDFDYGKYADDRDFGYGQYIDDRNYQYQVGRDQVSDNQWLQSFEYQQGRDTKSDEQWQAEFDEAKRQYDQAYALQTGKSSSSSSGNPGTSYDYDTRGYTEEQIKQLQRRAGITVDGVWGPQTEAAYNAGYRWNQSPEEAYSDPGEPIWDDMEKYNEVTGILNQLIARGATKSQINGYLREAAQTGDLTNEQYQDLKELYAPKGNTY
jgi:hypothetical protein